MKVILISLVVLWAGAGSLFGQWMATGGPCAGSVETLASESTTVLAGGIGLVFRSSDGGVHWIRTGAGLPDDELVRALAIKGPVYFAGTVRWYRGAPYGKAYRSTDAGGTWTPTTLGKPVECFAWFGRDLLAAGWSGIYRSTDEGISWDTVAVKNVYYVNSLLTTGTDIFAGAEHGVFRSTDGGETWSTDPMWYNNPDKGSVLALTFHGGRLFAGVRVTGLPNHVPVFVSADSGMSWTPAAGGIPGTLNVNALVSRGGVLYAATSGGVYRSTDDGGSWTIVSTGLPAGGVADLIGLSDRLCAGTFNGVFLSADGGAVWEPGNRGLSSAEVRALTIAQHGLLAGTWRAGVWRSSNDGETWVGSSAGIEGATISDLVQSGSDMYAAALGGGVYRSSDGGGHWTAYSTGLPSGQVVSLAVHGTAIYAATAWVAISRSTDRGMEWASVKSGFADNYVNRVLVSEGVVYASTSTHVYRLTGDGALWEYLGGHSGFSGYMTTLNTFAVRWPQICAGWIRPIVYSLDGGRTWSSASEPAPWDVGVLIWRKDALIAGGREGVWTSFDAGKTWQSVNEGLPAGVKILSLAANDSILFAGTSSSGVWKRALSEMGLPVGPDGSSPGLDDPSVGDPAAFHLAQNYPNPFNPTTTIGFSCPTDGPVVLELLDLLGRRVMVLVDGFMPSGTHRVSVDGTGLAGGVYLYRLRAGGYAETRKLILLH